MKEASSRNGVRVSETPALPWGRIPDIILPQVSYLPTAHAE